MGVDSNRWERSSPIARRGTIMARVTSGTKEKGFLRQNFMNGRLFGKSGRIESNRVLGSMLKTSLILNVIG